MGEAADPFASTEKGAAGALVGTIVGEYRATSLLATGGMAEVYAAEHVRLGRAAAIKFLSAELATDQKILRRFVAEAKAVAALQLSSIVDVYDIYEGSRPAIVMELLRGETLAGAIARGPIDVTRVKDILAQLLGCLDVVHRRGIVHRDLKPSNLFLVDDPVRRDRLKVLDFGIAKFADGSRFGLTSTGEGAIIGTPQYLSPEQIEGKALDGRTDLYAVGCIAYEMLVGEPPFRAPTLTSLMSKHLLERPASVALRRTDVPPGLAALVARCLEKRPEDRHRDAAAALASLDALPELARAPSAARPQRLAWLALAVGVVIMVGLWASFGRRGSNARSDGSTTPARRVDAGVVLSAATDAAPRVHACTGAWARRTSATLPYVDEITVIEGQSSCGTWRTSLARGEWCEGSLVECSFNGEVMRAHRKCVSTRSGKAMNEQRLFELECHGASAKQLGVTSTSAHFDRR